MGTVRCLLAADVIHSLVHMTNVTRDLRWAKLGTVWLALFVALLALTLVLSGDGAGADDTNGVVALEMGGAHSCALLASGEAWCWGWNFYGNLGRGNTESGLTPAPVCESIDGGVCEPLQGVVSLSGGEDHTCAVVEDGRTRCWGLNADGQLGDRTTVDRHLPIGGCVPVEEPASCWTDSAIVAAAAGSSHSCGVGLSTLIACWGDNDRGQLGFGETIARPAGAIVCTGPAPGCVWFGSTQEIVAGDDHTCALMADRTVRCWGDNAEGQLGDGGACGGVCPYAVVVCVPGAGRCGWLTDVVSLSAGAAHTCAVLTDGELLCWGRNAQGQLGDGTTQSSDRPVAAALTDVAAVAAGVAHTCAVNLAGGVRCWGSNSVGQLGDGGTQNSLTPVQVEGLESGVLSISAGGSHTCALLESGGVRCWGWNADGRLGDGTFTPRRAPVEVVGLAEKPPPAPTAAPPPAARGDANCYGGVDAIDAALVLQMTAGLLPAVGCPAAADADGDGDIDAIDAALVLQFVAGLLAALP